MGPQGEELGPLGRGQPIALGEDGVEVLDRLTVGAGDDGLSSGDRSGFEQQVDVIATNRVVDDPRRVLTAVMEMAGETAMEAHGLGRGQRVLHGVTDELVPEPDVRGITGDDPALLGRHEAGLAVPAEELDQLSFDADRHDRDRPHDLDVLRGELAEAADDRVLDASGEIAGRRGDQLGHEQRVAAAGVEHLRGVPRRVDGEERDRVDAEGPEAEMGHVRPADRAQQLPHRVAEAHVLVPVGDDDHEGQVAHARRELADHVDGGVVGPVDVLDDDDAAPFRPGAEEDRGQARAAEVICDLGLQVVRQLGDEVPDRAERPRRQQVVAAHDDHELLAAEAGDEALQQ